MLSFVEKKDPSLDVVVTGIGLVTPLGLNCHQTWQRLLRGETAARHLSIRDIDHYKQLLNIGGLNLAGCPLNHEAIRSRLLSGRHSDHPADTGVDAGIVSAWLDEPVVAMTLVACREAIEQSGLELPFQDPFRTASFLGASKGGLRSTERLVHRAVTSPHAPNKAVTSLLQTTLPAENQAATNADPGSPLMDCIATASAVVDTSADSNMLWQHAFPTDAACRAVSAMTGIRGASSCPVAACATGLVSLLQASSAIHHGQFDICLAGSADAALRSSVMSSFHRLRVTSRHKNPETACRPFDVTRDGFVIGEGAAVFVLESRAHAEARGANVLARVTAGGWLSDPSGMTQIDTSGDIVAELLVRTLDLSNHIPSGHSTGQPGSQIDHINLHGTGTESNDLAEARGIHKAWRQINPATRGKLPMCSATKGATGHLLGGAGSVESALTLLSLRDGVCPPTRNLTTVDPSCNLPLLKTATHFSHSSRALKLSLGFGGHVACAVFDRESKP
ncbi:MAG: beta-ketoacyl-[acyl-carrier-protein] synthase family protein [Planctomycetaceae bacterium]|nr:beta-ketoacyl-[acyl-carrier-protein] synthase family protein [Planctomycetaceae bacterium]